MSFTEQYHMVKKVARKMLVEAGVEEYDLDLRVSEMSLHILDDLYQKNYSDKEITDAIKVLAAATSFN